MSDLFQYTYEKNITCDLETIRAGNQYDHLALAVKKNLRFKEMLNVA